MRSPAVGPGSSSYQVSRGRPGSEATIRASTSAGRGGAVIAALPRFGMASAVLRSLDGGAGRGLGERLVVLQRREQGLGALGVPLDRQCAAARAVGEVGDGHRERQALVVADRAHRPKHADGVHDAGLAADGEPRGGGVREALVAPRDEDGRGPRSLLHERPEELALARRAADVTERVLVAGPDVAEGVATVERLTALLEVDAGLLVHHVAGDAQVDPTHAVDDAGEATEPDLDVAVDVDSGGLLDRLGQQL